jgi:hypothetical protein
MHVCLSDGGIHPYQHQNGHLQHCESDNAVRGDSGVVFAGVQIRQYQRQRKRDAMLKLVRSFQSPAFTAALRRVLSPPDDAGSAKIREVLGPAGEDAVYLVSLSWESLAVLVFRREVTLNLVDHFFSGPLVLSWRKLRVCSEEWRRVLNGTRETSGFTGWRDECSNVKSRRRQCRPTLPIVIGANRVSATRISRNDETGRHTLMWISRTAGT